MARPRKMAPPSILPASLILTSHEQKHYRRYQRTQTRLSTNEHGFLPSADEYAAFQCWLKQRDSGYLSDEPLGGLASYLQVREGNIAELCKHTLHPSFQRADQSFCPVCIMDLHLHYMHLLQNHVKGVNGKVPQRWEPTNNDHVVDAWRAGKLSLLHTVHDLEQQAIEEMAWAAQNPSANIEHAKTAEQALQVYHKAMDLDSPTISPQSSESETSPTLSASSSSISLESAFDATPRRTVRFDADTDYSLGRPTHYFWRRSPRYKAGKYAVDTTADERTAILVGASEPSGKLSPRNVNVINVDHTIDDEDSDNDEVEDKVPEHNAEARTSAAIATTVDAGHQDAEHHVQPKSGISSPKGVPAKTEKVVEKATSAGISCDDSDSEWQELDDSDSKSDLESDTESTDEDEDEDEDMEDGEYIVFEEETSYIVFAD